MCNPFSGEMDVLQGVSFRKVSVIFALSARKFE